MAVWLTVFALHAASPIKTPFDSHWSIPTALSPLREHNFDLDEYRPTQISHGVLSVDGHLVTEYPLGAPLLAAPCLLVFDAVVRAARPLLGPFPVLSRNADRWLQHFDATGLIDLSFFDTTEMVLASLLVGAAAAVIFLFARLKLAVGPSLLLAGCFAFGTSAWSTASRALWQQGPSMLMLSLALWGLLRVGERAGWAGAALAAAWVLLSHRERVVRFSLGVAAVLLPFFALNLSVYGTPLSSYFTPAYAGQTSHFWSGLLGSLLSPSRGVLVYSPIFLFAGWGAWLAHRKKSLGGLERPALLVLALHAITLGRFWCWWGGACYGPRLFADLVPVFMLLLVPVLGQLFPEAGALPPRRLRAAFAVALALSVAIHFRGATTWAVYAWNDAPSAVDDARAWDFGDVQFLRGL